MAALIPLEFFNA